MDLKCLGPKASCYNGRARILCQPSSPCGEESKGNEDFGRL